jgi:hypothetical protein
MREDAALCHAMQRLAAPGKHLQNEANFMRKVFRDGWIQRRCAVIALQHGRVGSFALAQEMGLQNEPTEAARRAKRSQLTFVPFVSFVSSCRMASLRKTKPPAKRRSGVPIGV